MLQEISDRTSVHWGRFTILAPNEFLAPPARIVRLRFPETGIWSLPIAAHELGHYIVPKIGEYDDDGSSTFPFLDLQGEEEERGPQRHRRELFADAFAAYVVGPAFLMAYLFLRFDPNNRRTASWTHPSDSLRMEALLASLECADDAQQYGAILDLLRSASEVSIAAGSPDGPVTPAGPGQPQHIELAHRAYALLSDYEPVARYDGWLRAQLLARALAGDDPKLPLDGVGPWDVVNAAWLCRIESKVTEEYALRNLSAVAVQACWEVMGGRPKQPGAGGRP
jgi:hypothetical protein